MTNSKKELKGTWYVRPGSSMVTVSDDNGKSTAVRFHGGIGFLKPGSPLEARVKKHMEVKGIKGYSSLGEAEKAAGRTPKKKKNSK